MQQSEDLRFSYFSKVLDVPCGPSGSMSLVGVVQQRYLGRVAFEVKLYIAGDLYETQEQHVHVPCSLLFKGRCVLLLAPDSRK